jgi:hypothetical protein
MIERLGRNFSALEVTLRAKTIEDAAASTLQRADNSALEQPLAAPAAGSPAWTQANQGDPGVTLLELLSWVDALDAYRTARSFDNPARRAAVGAAARPVTDSDP